MSVNERNRKTFGYGLLIALMTLILLQSLGTVRAQIHGYVQAECPAIVKQAIDTISAQCGKTGRGKLCYGNSTITAQFRSNTGDTRFQVPGDIVDVSVIRQFALSGMDVASQTWGVAEMKIRADLPDTDPTEAVTMILFGSVQLRDASADANAAVLTQTPGAVARQNQQATRDAATATKIAGLEASATAGAMAPLASGTVPALTATKAAHAATQLAAYEATSTAVHEGSNGPYKDLQAFYFQSSDTAPCEQAPHDGILVQSPQATNKRATLVIDGASITLGSTVYITAQPGKFLTVDTLEGSATVSAAGITITAGPGTALRVPLDANLRPTGAPQFGGFYTMDAVRALPTTVLPTTALTFISGLPPEVTFSSWTNTLSLVSGHCYAGDLPTRTFPVTVAYNDVNLWYSVFVFTKSAAGTYVGTYSSPITSGPKAGKTANYSFVWSVISPSQITGTESGSTSDGSYPCTLHHDLRLVITATATP